MAVDKFDRVDEGCRGSPIAGEATKTGDHCRASARRGFAKRNVGVDIGRAVCEHKAPVVLWKRDLEPRLERNEFVGGRVSTIYRGFRSKRLHHVVMFYAHERNFIG